MTPRSSKEGLALDVAKSESEDRGMLRCVCVSKARVDRDERIGTIVEMPSTYTGLILMRDELGLTIISIICEFALWLAVVCYLLGWHNQPIYIAAFMASLIWPLCDAMFSPTTMALAAGLTWVSNSVKRRRKARAMRRTKCPK